MLLAGAGMLLASLVALQTANTGYDMRHVLAFDVPASVTGLGDAEAITFYQEATRRISGLPGVEGVAVGSFVPCRDAGSMRSSICSANEARIGSIGTESTGERSQDWLYRYRIDWETEPLRNTSLDRQR